MEYPDSSVNDNAGMRGAQDGQIGPRRLDNGALTVDRADKQMTMNKDSRATSLEHDDSQQRAVQASAASERVGKWRTTMTR